jgi:hypothetical protein
MTSFRFVGYAIVSADGMLAADHRGLPASLRFAGDQRFFEAGLDAVDLIVHGRNSGEVQPRSPQRRRLIVTRSVTAPMRDPTNPKATLWNPAHASFEEASAAAGVGEGTVAPIGGTNIFDMFLDRYDTFWLTQAPHVRLPGGVPVFHGVPARSPQEILHAHGMRPGAPQVLDAAHDVSVVGWTRG